MGQKPHNARYDHLSGPGKYSRPFERDKDNAKQEDLTPEESAIIKFISNIQKAYIEHETKLYQFHEQFYNKYLKSLEQAFTNFNAKKTDFSEIMPYLSKLEEILKELKSLELNPTIEVNPEVNIPEIKAPVSETIIPDSEKSAKSLFTIEEGKEYTQTIFKIHCLQTNKEDCTLAVSNTSNITFPPHSFIRGAIYPINLVKLIDSGDAIFVGYSTE